MNIDLPLRELGEINSDALTATILNTDAGTWQANEYRQQAYDVHYNTQSLVMLFTEAKDWPQLTVSREAGWDILAATAQPLIDQIIAQHYAPGGVVIRAMAARLVSGCVIKPHVDAHPSFHQGHRIHIPITTNPRVRFSIDGRPYQFQVGQAYEINNQLMHSVMNKGTEDRITFIFDYVPPSHLNNFNVTFSD
jgi:hypothetical protein